MARQLLKEDDWTKCSSGPSGQRVWSKLWHLRLPNKIKVFGWRAYLEILPTRVNLAKRRIIPDNMCHCCRRYPERRVHVLWECGAAQDVWAGCLVRIQKIPNGQSDTLQLFEELMDRLTGSEFELFLVQAWLIWNQRNTVLHSGSFKEPGWLNKRATELLEEYHKSQVQLSISTPTSLRISWQPPPISVFKVNFDAVVFSKLKCSGFGAIIWKDRGEVIAAMSVKGPPVTCSERQKFSLAVRRQKFSRARRHWSFLLVQASQT